MRQLLRCDVEACKEPACPERLLKRHHRDIDRPPSDGVAQRADEVAFRMNGDPSGMVDLYPGRRDQEFPTLTRAQLAKLEKLGRRMVTVAGQILLNPGEPVRSTLIVLSGSIEVLRPGTEAEVLICVHRGEGLPVN